MCEFELVPEINSSLPIPEQLRVFHMQYKQPISTVRENWTEPIHNSDGKGVVDVMRENKYDLTCFMKTRGYLYWNGKRMGRMGRIVTLVYWNVRRMSGSEWNENSNENLFSVGLVCNQESLKTFTIMMKIVRIGGYFSYKLCLNGLNSTKQIQ